MTAVSHSPDRDNIILDIGIEDLKNIRRYTLGNIAGEILQISDFVEENIVDLSDEFIRLVKYSRQQTEGIITACGLLPRGDAARKILTETLEISADFHKNVNRMIYSMQFQDRARQLMQAIAVTVDILINLSETIENDQDVTTPGEELIISQKIRTILNRLIEDAAHRELDQNYIVKMFLGDVPDERGTNRLSDSTDIEFF